MGGRAIVPLTHVTIYYSYHVMRCIMVRYVRSRQTVSLSRVVLCDPIIHMFMMRATE